MQDEYNKLTGEQTIGVFTGKPYLMEDLKEEMKQLDSVLQ